MSKFLMSLKSLERWFESQKRILPWRNLPSVYRVWISEVMLQQTQVVTVVPYFEKFVAKFPTVEGLAMASEADVMHLWAGLGYYSRARNIHKTAKIINKQGKFPKTKEEWLDMPGVGPYTAGAILSIAENLPEPILDVNVERVLSRVWCVNRENEDRKFKTRLWRLSRLVVKRANANRIKPSICNQAIMELGATLCSVRAPQCAICPLGKICRAYKRKTQEEYPPKKKPKKWVEVEEKLHCIVDRNGRVLLRQRQDGEWRAGLWDLVEKIPQELKNQVRALGELKTRHVVTKHKILRTTSIWALDQTEKPPAIPLSISSGKASSTISGPSDLPAIRYRWVSSKKPEVAVGSAAKKVLSALGG